MEKKQSVSNENPRGAESTRTVLCMVASTRGIGNVKCADGRRADLTQNRLLCYGKRWGLSVRPVHVTFSRTPCARFLPKRAEIRTEREFV